jgi:hypothetical protein
MTYSATGVSDVDGAASRIARAVVTTLVWLGCSSVLTAQAVEVSPFGGYRFGGGFFERITGQAVDLDGAPAFGAAVDVPLLAGLQVEGVFSHQRAHVFVPGSLVSPPTSRRIDVDHWLAGGLREFRAGQARPFLTGMLGLTRYATESDSEIRFTMSAGGGVKLLPWRHVGLRLETRVFATFVDAKGTLLACAPGVCFLGLNTDVVWQAEFTAGILLKWP